MKFTETPIVGCIVVGLERRIDDRGFFSRQYCREEFVSHGLDPEIDQINVSRSLRAGTLRGMHYQMPPRADNKFVMCTYGAVFDVCLDLRPNSKSYLQWFGVELTEENGLALYLPAGTAHGFLTLADNACIMYATNQPYAPDLATGVRFDDEAFGIAWPAPVDVVSEADQTWPDFDEDAHRRAVS